MAKLIAYMDNLDGALRSEALWPVYGPTRLVIDPAGTTCAARYATLEDAPDPIQAMTGATTRLCCRECGDTLLPAAHFCIECGAPA